VSLALISGRYYPRLLAHPMLRPIVRDMQGHANEAAAKLEGHRLFALEGILPGFFNASEATRWKPSRAAMVRDSAEERSTALVRVWDGRRQGAQEEEAAASAPTGSAGEASTVLPLSQGQDAADAVVDVGIQNLEPAPAEASTLAQVAVGSPARSVSAA